MFVSRDCSVAFLVGICCTLGLAQGEPQKWTCDQSGSNANDPLKRDGTVNPNDLFWANRGKKSDANLLFWPKPHSFMGPMMSRRQVPLPDLTGDDFEDYVGERNRRAGNFALKPNSFMNMMYSAQPKRNVQHLRPNSFLFPSLAQSGKRSSDGTMWNVARPNSHLFPQMMLGKPGKRETHKNLKPNSFIFPIPKRDEFFAGRGKRQDDEADAGLDEDSFEVGLSPSSTDESPELWLTKRAAPDLSDANFFAGRGKKAAAADDLTFFAGRGKREAKGKDDKDNAIFWAVRG